MSLFEDMTPERIQKRILERVGTTLETREGSFLASMIAPVSVELWKLYAAMNAIVPIAYVDESSGGYIDLRCSEFGIHRKEGTRARGVLTLTGKAKTRVPAGTVFLTGDGLGFLLAEEVVLTGGEDAAEVEAEREGTAYNVGAGELERMVQNVAGLERWTSGPTAGGTEAEGDADLVVRLYDYLQKPATSGNVYHYEQWALEVDGVGAVRVTPLSNGPGTVGVLIIASDKGPASPEIVEACAAHIESLRPVGASVTVESAVGLPVTVAAAVITDGSVTKEGVRLALEAELEGYLRLLAFKGDRLLFNRVAFALLSLPGVLDYTSLTVNGGTENVPIGWNEVPVLSGVSVT